jgi:hypothetical protein
MSTATAGARLLRQGWTTARHIDGRTVPLGDVADHIQSSCTVYDALRLICDDDPAWTEQRQPTADEIRDGASVMVTSGSNGWAYAGTTQVWSLPANLHPGYARREGLLLAAREAVLASGSREDYEAAAEGLGLSSLDDATLSGYGLTYFTLDPAQDPDGSMGAQQRISAPRRRWLQDGVGALEAAATVPDRQAAKVADQQAAKVADFLGLPAPAATGACHYCGLRLGSSGQCSECV